MILEVKIDADFENDICKRISQHLGVILVGFNADGVDFDLFSLEFCWIVLSSGRASAAEFNAAQVESGEASPGFRLARGYERPMSGESSVSLAHLSQVSTRRLPA